MISACRFVLGGLILVISATTWTVSVDGWDLWPSMDNDSVLLDGLGDIDEVSAEDEQTSDDSHFVSHSTDRPDNVGDFAPQSNTSSGNSSDVTSSDTFSDGDEGGKQTDGDGGFAQQLLKKTMDFFSGLLSPSESGTESSNSTETDSPHPNEPALDLCRDGDPSANCSESVSPDQQPEKDQLDTELEEPDGSDYPLIESTDSPLPAPTPIEPTWIDASSYCLRETIDRSTGNCDWEENRTLEGTIGEVFNDTVVKRLTKKCLPGEWCLHKHFSKHQTSAMKRSCRLLSCLDGWKDSSCPPSNVVWNALNLLCSLTNATTSDVCVISVLKMIHVTIADMIRIAIQPEDEASICSTEEDKDGCRGPCQQAGQNLRCMTVSCDNNTDLFEGFSEWHWLLGKRDSVEKCPFNSSDCLLFEAQFTTTSHGNAVMPHHINRHLLTFLKNNEWSMIAGLSLSVLFSLLVVCGIFLGLRCSGRRRLRQRLLRQRTMARDDGGCTRDRIQYTIITTQQDDFEDRDSDDMT